MEGRSQTSDEASPGPLAGRGLFCARTLSSELVSGKQQVNLA
jgi:hypothetical protein